MLKPNFEKVCNHIDKLDLANNSRFAVIMCEMAVTDTIDMATHEMLKNITEKDENQLIEFLAFMWYLDFYKEFK